MAKKAVKPKAAKTGRNNKIAKRAPKRAAKPKLAQRLRAQLDDVVTKVAELMSTAPRDLVSAIKKDHEGLRHFVDVLKDTDRDLAERRRAYALFSDLLKSHTEAEEKAVYAPIEKPAKSDLVIRIEEGYVEHKVAEDVMRRMEKTQDPTIWSAHANVLAELVEHHLDEEESELFPLIRKQISKKLEADLIVEYLDLRASTQMRVSPSNAGVLEVLKP